MLTSMICRYEDFKSSWFAKWSIAFKGYAGVPGGHSETWSVHRKAWEWCAIMEALSERGLLGEERSGCGFAVGTEPVPSLLAANKVKVLATDRPDDDGAKEWELTGQHSKSLESIFYPSLVDERDFSKLVQFEAVDMRSLELQKPDQFDFVWSSCSLEHLGSLDAGIQFILDAMRLVKPGGFAFHTTEFNVSSNDITIEVGPAVIYRRRDIEDLDHRLRLMSCGMASFEFDAGDHQYDIEYDIAPYSQEGRPHVKIMLDGHITTSCIMIIRKGRPASIR